MLQEVSSQAYCALAPSKSEKKGESKLEGEAVVRGLKVRTGRKGTRVQLFVPPRQKRAPPRTVTVHGTQDCDRGEAV